MSDLHVHPSTPPAVAAPNWQTVTDDVECFRCGYNLRGLAQPRCPECGLEFEWADLFDPARRRHPYLFEHQAQHGRQRAGSTPRHSDQPAEREQRHG